MLGARFFFCRKRSVFYFVQFQNSGRLQNLLDARRVIDTRQLHQNFAFALLAATGLNCRLSQSEPVYPRLNRVDGSLNGPTS